MKKRLHLVIPLAIVVIIVSIGAWWLITQNKNSTDTSLHASGTIEAREIRISPEVGGKVIDILVDEGDTVKKGDILLKLDSRMAAIQNEQMMSSIKAASAAIEIAQANLNLLEAGPTEEQLAVAQAAVKQARVAVSAAQETYDDLPEYLRDTPDAKAVKHQLNQAQAALTTARRQYDLVASGSRPEQIQIARAQLEAAHAQMDAAQASIKLVNLQLEKYTLIAPTDGIITTRSIEPGEFAAPGSTLLILIQPHQLTLKVYIPEDQYGKISLGQTVTIKVDSFPEDTFNGEVIHIASKAEFTPRNVQTSEGRKTTVFAVKISVKDTSSRLKPGMPADVTFQMQNSQPDTTP